MNPQLILVKPDKIGPNPHRNLGTYPWIEQKIAQLKQSITDVGLWEGIIARPAKHGGYELAFGHHRLETARRLKLKVIPIIVRNLTDAEMLKFMGRENGEDYSSEFLVMLNTWEGAFKFLNGGAPPKRGDSVEIARFMGWTRTQDGETVATDIAKTCASAVYLIANGYLTRDDFKGLSMKDAREVAMHAKQRAETLEDAGEANAISPRAYSHTKAQFTSGVRTAIQGVRSGSVPVKNIRQEIDFNAFDSMRPKKNRPPSPLFTDFAASLLKSIKVAFDDDVATQYLKRIEDALPYVSLDKDRELISDINHELGKVPARVEAWRKRLTLQKVVPLRAIEKESN